ncbi:aldehyde dehydrogenase family protein [Mangrovimicrobium sediminis]|uniref:Aldehyde dehydrogenase family protein n=1 Tax=Mangrovimicrobium sediminis TaxID=2562682 RepID=A0A4Z0M1S6_9GAMM|nr:aldehyde dehydrogenase family protein [Haliea sp. SAOS-164]TGD73491.1 aldehyde dehydrogenase family protein [Haliea sp. SAOS-164]
MAFALPDTSALPRYPLIIGDSLVERGSGEAFAHIYPGNGQCVAEVAGAGAADVDAAVSAARAAQPAWAALPGDARRDLLLQLAASLKQHAGELALLETLGNGSPVMMAGYAPIVAAQRFEYYAGWADKIRGQTLQAWNGPAHNYVDYAPYGVVGAVIPWNGPLFAAAMVMGPVLAAGNCIVIKAPELAPYSVMRLGELFLEAGFPPGVVNVLAGGPEVGAAIVGHADVDKVQFVGSGATARKVLASAAANLTPCCLELGGKSAVIVFDDADLARAGQMGLSGAISVSGQGCVNGTRLLVQRGIYEQYLGVMQQIAARITVGDPLDAGTVMGPVISEAAVQRILGSVEQARDAGARVLTGGTRLDGDYAEGFFLPLTVIADVAHDSDLAQHEVFGPVLSVTPFDTEEEAIHLANDCDYGLGAYIHTSDLRRAHHVAGHMQAGMVHVNASGEGMQPFAPFGGMKQSGFGRLGGEQGLLEFLQARNVWMNLKPAQA